MKLPGSVTKGARTTFRRAVNSFRSGAGVIRALARSARLALVTSLALSAAATARAEKLPLERLFGAPDLNGPTLRGVEISPDGKLIAYLKARDDDKDRFDLWAYDVPARRHRLLVDSRTLAGADKALSADEVARRERQRTAALSGIVEYNFAPDSRHLLIPLNGDLYVYDLGARTPAGAVRRLTATEGYETDARFSPHSHYVSFVRDQNLYVIDLADGRERAVTRDGGGLVSYGMAEFIAQEEMDRDTGYWWSPDERRIVLERMDESPVAEIERFEIQATGARVVRQRYPATGAANARTTLLVADLAADSRQDLDLGTGDYYLPRVDWFPDSRGIAVQRQSRDQKTLELMRFDALSGRGHTLITERSEHWVPLHHELTFLLKQAQFIWASSRDGFQHLYLYANDGKLIRQLTSGEYMVLGESPEGAVRAVDERARRVFFTANLASPLERQLYSVSLDAPVAPRRISKDAGWHGIDMSVDARVYVDTFSSVSTPRNVSLRDASGALLTELLPNKIAAGHPYAPYAAEHATAEFGSIPAADGQQMYYRLLKPKTLEPGRRYPVLVDVYGGPGVQRVTNTWGSLFHQYLVQQGYVVFMLDNRGSGMRGTRFETALGGRMGHVEVEDQVKGVEFLRGQSYVDPARIGIFGWSYGGYMTLMCLMQAPDAFAAGIAGAPVTDWALYDTHYTERYLSTPQANAAGYEAITVLNYVEKLRRPLLLVHGMADDNVLFANSTALMKKLQDLQKPFDLMTYPGGKHGLIRQAGPGLHASANIVRFFDRELKEGSR
jgi:dipeptidyl-peptidase-4